MTDFVSKPPSEQQSLDRGLISGGLVPATRTQKASMLIFDLSALDLSLDEGKALEADIRETLLEKLDSQGKNLNNMSAVDLSGTVLGVSIK
jgi:hypothetical protein